MCLPWRKSVDKLLLASEENSLEQEAQKEEQDWFGEITSSKGSSPISTLQIMPSWRHAGPDGIGWAYTMLLPVFGALENCSASLYLKEVDLRHQKNILRKRVKTSHWGHGPSEQQSTMICTRNGLYNSRYLSTSQTEP
jgi:hypothetical protein